MSPGLTDDFAHVCTLRIELDRCGKFAHLFVETMQIILGLLNALDKLKRGADFKWVSSNATGIVPADEKGVLNFDQNLLSLTSLPEDLQALLSSVAKGSSLLYAPEENNFYYILQVKDLFPPESLPFEEINHKITDNIFSRKAKELLDQYIKELKKFYEIEIFIKDNFS